MRAALGIFFIQPIIFSIFDVSVRTAQFSFQHHNYANRWRELWLSTWKEFSIECVHMTSRDHVGGVNKETAAMLEEWILLGIELYFYAHFSFSFIMQNGFWSHERRHSIRVLAPKTFGNNIFLSEIDGCINLVLYLFPADENVCQGQSRIFSVVFQ